MPMATTGNGKAVAARLDVAGYRERVAGALGIAADELISSRRNDPRLLMTQMCAAHLLLHGDRLPIGDTARVMDKSEEWARVSRDYIERRVNRYYAFSVYIEKTMAPYLASARS